MSDTTKKLKALLPVETTNNLKLPLPRSASYLDNDVYALRQALGIIDRNLWATMQANVLLEDGGAGLYSLITRLSAQTARSEVRMARLELELAKHIAGSVTGGGSGGEVTSPGYDPDTGAYRGPVAIGTSLLDMGDAGILFLLPEESGADDSGLPD